MKAYELNSKTPEDYDELDTTADDLILSMVYCNKMQI